MHLWILIDSILFIHLTYGAHLRNSNLRDLEIKSLQILPASTKPYSTFITLLDKSVVTPYYSNKDYQATINKNENRHSYQIFNGVNLNFEQIRIFLISIILIAIILILIILWIMKKFTDCFLLRCCINRLCRCKNQSSADTSRSNSVMSGECGCAMRFRKEKNKNHINQEKSPSQINENFLTRANQILKAQNPNFKRQVSVSLNDVYVTRNFFQKIPLQKIKTVKSALVLLALKPCENYDLFESVNSISNEKLIARTIISEEDLNDYDENYLILFEMHKDLVLLDNLNKLKR